MDHRATLASTAIDDTPTITLSEIVSGYESDDTCPSLFDRGISDLGGPADPNQV